MAKPKGTLIALRVSEVEKALLEAEAKDQAMTLSQYVRYKVLEAEPSQNTSQERSAIAFLDRNIAKLTRMFIDGYFCTKAMAIRQLSDQDQSDTLESAYEQFKELGITKGKERYGKNKPNQ